MFDLNDFLLTVNRHFILKNILTLSLYVLFVYFRVIESLVQFEILNLGFRRQMQRLELVKPWRTIFGRGFVLKIFQYEEGIGCIGWRSPQSRSLIDGRLISSLQKITRCHNVRTLGA